MVTSQVANAVNTDRRWVDSCNTIMENLYGCIDSEINRSFGSSMLCRERHAIPVITTAYRILKKFERPSPGKKNSLEKECFRQWIEHEESLATFSFADIPNAQKSVLYRAREILHSWFADFKPSKTLIEFTPGETFFSMKGKVSVYQKLSNRECWTVTHDAVDDFVRLCYNNLMLKRCAKALMPRLTPKQRTDLWKAHKSANHVGYACFSFMMKNFVITVVHGSRASTVDKNNTERRFINVEPLGNMLLQRQVAGSIRNILKREGNDLEMGQLIHRARIALRQISTIDFSKASDSVILDAVVHLFPNAITKYLVRYRSPMCLVGTDYYVPHKLSSMGCGFTFEVMSAMLCAIGRVFDPTCTVYGDDVIINTAHAEAYIAATDAIGFKTNMKKTFVNSPFRESCGAFYHDAYGYITCYDFHWNESINDVIITTNKLYLMLQSSTAGLLPACFGEAYEALLRITPTLYRAYTHYLSEPDSGFVQDINARRKHMQSAESRSVRRRNQCVLDWLANRFQVSQTDFLLVKKPKFVSKLATPNNAVLKTPAAYAACLHAGRRFQDVIRNSGYWDVSLQIVHPEFSMSVKDAKNQMKIERRALGLQVLGCNTRLIQ